MKSGKEVMKQEVTELWRLCFDDTEAFIHFYFDRKYKEENALVYRDEQGDVIAALQMPLYPMSFWGTRVLTGYISGACTHPLARARGVMKTLLRETFDVMRERGVMISTLIPANEWLYGYYGKMGYATVFDYMPEHYVLSDEPVPGHFRVEAMRGEAVVTDELFDYFSGMMWQRPCCVQHDREDFGAVTEDLCMSGGALIVAYGGEGRIAGMAFAESRGSHVLVKDWLYSTDEAKQALLQGIVKYLDAGDVFCRTLPSGKSDEHQGMARILDVEQVLRLYAINNPDQHFTLKVTDEWLPENTGVYIVGKGGCNREPGARAETELTVQELTRLLFGYHPEQFPGMMQYFKTFHPFISLMLD